MILKAPLITITSFLDAFICIHNCAGDEYLKLRHLGPVGGADHHGPWRYQVPGERREANPDGDERA